VSVRVFEGLETKRMEQQSAKKRHEVPQGRSGWTLRETEREREQV